MTSNLPLPIPPRTPTPPSDDGRDQYVPRTTPGVSIDRDSLSPLKESFPRSATLDPMNSDLLSPTKSSFNLSPRAADTLVSAQNGSNDSVPAAPFNFNTTVMSKGPVVKSVSLVEILTQFYPGSMLIYLSLFPEHRTASWSQVQAQ